MTLGNTGDKAIRTDPPETVGRVIAQQLRETFDRGPVSVFKAFVARNGSQRHWILGSDYNWRERTRPQNVLAFTVYPKDRILPELERLFPSDFKKTQDIPEETAKWFREGNAFHICVMLDKHGSLFNREGRGRLDLAQESVVETRRYLEKIGAPNWSLERIRNFERYSRSRRFKIDLYEDVIVLSVVYAFIVGLIARERQIEQVTWCSDRDDRTNWAERIIATYALMSGSLWAGQYGRRLDAAQLPFMVMGAKGPDPIDALIRPADYLAGAISTVDLVRGTGTQEADKYGQMLRAIAGNTNIALLRLKVDGSMIHASRVEARHHLGPQDRPSQGRSS